MELKVESKIGTVLRSSEQIYELLSDFSRLSSFVPPAKVQDWQATADECRFSVNGVGPIVFRAVQREPSDLVKIAVETAQAKDVFLWIQLKGTQPYETKIKLTLKADVNPVMKIFIERPAQQFLDKVIDTLSRI